VGETASSSASRESLHPWMSPIARVLIVDHYRPDRERARMARIRAGASLWPGLGFVRLSTGALPLESDCDHSRAG
jgi:hypothetical protein